MKEKYKLNLMSETSINFLTLLNKFCKAKFII